MVPTRSNKIIYRSNYERKYAEQLDWDKKQGTIIDWYYEFITFKLADGSRYTPDFVVIRGEGIECIEIKGFLRTTGRAKFLYARDKFPYFKWTMKAWNKKEKYFYEIQKEKE
jgi:hypothetical protein